MSCFFGAQTDPDAEPEAPAEAPAETESPESVPGLAATALPRIPPLVETQIHAGTFTTSWLNLSCLDVLQDNDVLSGSVHKARISG